MKIIKQENQEKQFYPINITIQMESIEDVAKFHSLFNTSVITDFMGYKFFSQDVRDFLNNEAMKQFPYSWQSIKSSTFRDLYEALVHAYGK